MKKLLFILLLAVATGCHKSDDGASAPQGGEVTVDFTLAGVRAVVRPAAAPAVRADEGATTPTTGTPVALAEGATVRILAFARAAANADIANDTFIAEATYVADASGALTPCVVDADGAVTTGTAKAMRIPPAEYKYDFYAITPAVAVPDHRAVSVGHGVDYACSLTSEEITPRLSGAQTVALNTLVRHCTQLMFSIAPDSDTDAAQKITEVAFTSVELKYISPAPYKDNICSVWKPDSWIIPLTSEASVAACNYVVPQSKFSPVEGSKVSFVGSDVVLPKKKADFVLKMELAFNGVSATSPLTAPIKGLALAAGYSYKFAVKLQGAKLVLKLVVTPWEEIAWGDGDYDDSIGEWPQGSVTVGEWWLDITWDETELGGSFIPTVNPGAWVGNPAWDTDIADFPSLSGVPLTGYDAWTDAGSSDSDLGDSFHGKPTDPGWNSNTSDSGDMGADDPTPVPGV